MSAGRYSAGRIFLQVVPSFKHFQRDVEREAKKVNATLDKQVSEAAGKAGRKQGREVGKNFAAGFGEATLAEEAKYRIAIAKQIGQTRQAALVADQKARAGAKKSLQAMLDERLAMLEKQQKAIEKAEADHQAALDKIQQKSLDTQLKDRLRHQEDMKRIAARSLEQQLKDRVKARAEQEAAEKAANERAAKAEAKRLADEAALRAKEEKLREAARVKEEKDQKRHWDALGRMQEQAFFEGEKIAARKAKAESDRLRTRGGAARAEVEKVIKAIEKNIGDVDISTPLGKELDRLKSKALQTSRDISKGIITTDEGVNNIRALGREFRKLSRSGQVDLSTKGNLRQSIRDIDDFSRASTRASSNGGLLRGMLRGLTGDGQDGANAFRIFNYRILAVVTLLPLLVPLLAAAAGGIVALSTAALGAGAGLGVMVLGFAGVGKAVKAMGDVQKNATKDGLQSATRLRNAARGLRDAEQGLTRARQQAARSAEDSNRRIASAEEDLADAQKDATKAQNDLRLARRAAQQDQNDLADKIKSGQLDERQALIDLFNAQVAYNAAMADGGATNLEKEQASIDLERARLAIKGIRDENAALAKESKKSNAQRVEEDSRVVAAKEGVANAQSRIKDAEQGVVDARQAAALQAVDSQIAIRDATERVADAQIAQQEAVAQTGEIGSASVDKLREAMDSFSPAGQRFARYLYSLRGQFQALRDAAQEGMLPGVQEAMETIIGRYGPGFLRFVGSMSTVLGALFVQAGETFTSPVWADFFAMMEKMAPIFTQQFGDVFLNLLTGFAAVMTAFAPMSKDFGDALVSVTKSFAEWAAGLGDNKGFQEFVAYLRKEGPKVWEVIKAIAGAFVAIGIAMAPVADKLLDFAISFFDYIAKMDPDVLAGIVTAILGLVLASQVAAGITQTFISLAAPFHSVLALAAFALVALGYGILYAYQHSETFREVFDKVVGFVRDNWKWFAILGAAVVGIGAGLFGVFKVMSFLFGPLRAATLLIRAVGWAFRFLTGSAGLWILAIGAVVLALVWLWKNNETFRRIVTVAWEAVGKAVMWLWENYFKPYFGFIWKILKDVGAFVWWFWSKVVGPVFQLIGAIIKFTWETYIKPILGWIGDKFSALGGVIRDVWMQYIDPILDKFGLGAKDLEGIWGKALKAIGAAWASLKGLVGKPIEFIVGLINTGFVDNFNKLAKFFGTDTIPYLRLPSQAPAGPKSGKASYGGGGSNGVGGYATGGYTGPGAKYQPAGIVHADEYVIRKESTNKLRSKYGLQALDYINRFGELPGMGYATGGLVGFGKKLQEMGFNVGEHPAFGGVAPVHTTNSWHYKGGAIDVNYDGHGQAFETARINAILGLAKQYGLRTIWQSKGHFDHAHFDVSTGADIGSFSGAGDNNGAPWFLSKPLEYLRKAVVGLSSKMGDDPFSKFLTKMPLKVIDMASERILGIVGDNNGDRDIDTGKNNPSAGVEQWRPIVLAALGRLGQSTSLADTVLRRMNQESSGDVRAINLWDSNARAGIPSKGLMQVIDPTFARFRDRALPNDIYNPMANITASMRYAMATYGSLSSAYNRGGGYADGGLVGTDGLPDNGTMMYDSGGYIPPGITQVVNLTGKPEPVFTADQFSGMGANRGGSAPLIGSLDVTAQGSDLSARDVADEIIYAVTRVSHGGKFAGRTN